LSDVNANIGIVFDTTEALASLRQLQAGLSRFNQSLTQGNVAAANAQKGLNDQLVQAINSTGKFVASQKTVATSTSAFTTALEKNQLSMREYFRYTAAAATANTKVLGRAFTAERDIINRARRDRVKALQSQYIQLTSANGELVKVLKVVPKHLEMTNGRYADYATRVQMAAQRQQLLNQLIKQGSTQLLNFGKNTQWAGRQLMVGLTIPLTMLGSVAMKTFRDMEEAVVKFTRVYGDMTTTSDATNKAVQDIQRLGKEFTKYGIAVKDTVEMAAKAAAMGLTGNDLNQQVIAATKLSVLGQVEQQQALETTISLQNAFGIAATDLAQKINFLNAVENQTVLSIEDLTIAVPKAGPVIKQLGGSVEDLAFFMTAMKEGGINASEGANALKSGLASMINPSKKASEFLAGLGINIKGLVEANKGDLKGTVVGFARALDTLDPLNRARAIEQLFGKFQFARLSTLFQNVTKDSSQAARALGLAGASVEELAILSERELGKVENAVGVKFQKSIEQLKQELVPVGKAFLEALTPIVNFFGKILERFNNFSDGTKKAIAVVIGVVGGLAPVALMTFGLLANGLANLIKFFAMLRGGMAKLNGQNAVLGGGFDYLTQQEIENLTETNALHMSHKTLIDTFNVEAGSVNALAAAYANAGSQARALAASSPGLFNAAPGAKGAVSGIRMSSGGVVPGTGNKDTVPAVLTPGEVVLTKQTVKDNPETVAALQNGSVRKYMAGTADNSRSGASYRGTHNLIMGRSGFDNGQLSQTQSITPSKDLPGFLQKEYDRIAKLNEANLKRYAELTGMGTEKTMEEIRAAVLKNFEELLAEVKAKTGKLTQEGLNEIGKAPGADGGPSIMGRWFKKFDEGQGGSFAHVGDTHKVDIGTASGLKVSPKIQKQMDIVKAYYAETGRQAPDVRVADAFGFDMKQSVNRGMASPNQKNFEKKNGKTVGSAFEEEFAKTGAEKWKTMTELVGADFDKIHAQAEIYDKALLQKIQAWNQENAGKKIPEPFTDDVFLKLESEVRKDIDSLIPDFKAVIETAKRTITALRTSIKQEDLGPINDRLAKAGAGTLGPKASNAKYGNVEARTASEVLGTIDDLPESVEKSLTKAEQIAQTASPSKRTRKLGQDIGDGLIEGMKSREAGVASQSDRLANAASNIDTANLEKYRIMKEDPEMRQRQKSIDRHYRKLTGKLVTTTKLNDAIARQTKTTSVNVAESAAQEQRLNDLRQQEIIAKEQAVRNAQDAAAAGNYPGTSQSDLVAGDIGFIGPLTPEQQKTNAANLKAQRKLEVQQARGMRREAVGQYSGKVAGALGTAAMVSGMAGAPTQVTAALGTGSMVASFAPMLAGLSGPQGLALGVAAAAGSVWLMKKHFDATVKKQVDYINSISATTDKMKKIGEITGKVGASELYSRKRQEGSADRYTKIFERGKSQFGTDFFQSDVGKSIKESFVKDLAAGGDQASKKLALQLSAYISDGILTAEQAYSVARQIGLDLGNMTIGTKIQGEITNLVGPDGQNLLVDPLTIRIKIINTQNEITDAMTTAATNAQRTGSASSASTDSFAAAQALQSQNLTIIQAQRDAQKKMYDDEIRKLEAQKLATADKAKQLVIDGKIEDVKKRQAKDDAKLNSFTAKSLKQTSDLFDKSLKGKLPGQIGMNKNAVISASRNAVSAKYTGDAAPLAKALLSQTKGLKSEKIEVLINTLVSGGQLDTVSATNLLNIFGKDENGMYTQITAALKMQDPGKVQQLLTILSNFDEETAKDIFVKMTSKEGAATFENNMNTLSSLMQLDGKELDLEVFLKTKGNLEKLSALLDSVDSKIGTEPVTLTVIEDIVKANPDMPDMTALISDWDKWKDKDPKIQKSVVLTYIELYKTIGKSEIAQYRKNKSIPSVVTDSAVTGMIANDLLPNKVPTSIPSNKPGPASNTNSTGANPLDFLDSLAMRIKNVRDGAFDATTPLKSMIAAFSGKQAQKDVSKMFTLFDGLQQRMIKLGVPKEFRDMISGMSADDFKKFASLPKGKNMFTYEKGKEKTKANITGLTKEGQAVMQTYREAVIGEFNVAQKEVLETTKNQDAAFKILIASGMSTSDALKTVEDSAIAAGIASGAVGKKGSEEMKKFIADAQAASDATSRLNALTKARQANSDFAISKNAPGLAKSMKEAGYSADQINEALSDPDIAKYLIEDLKDGKIEAGDIKDYIDSIAEKKSIDIRVKLAMGDFAGAAEEGRQLVNEMFSVQEALIKNGPLGQQLDSNNQKIADYQAQLLPFQKQVADINQSIADAQRSIEIAYTRPIEALNTQVESLDRQLETSPIFGNRAMQAIQDQNTIYGNDLAIISHQADAVNKSYDEQVKNLNEVKAVNDQIIAQQGRQLGLADALTQGDIAAAAQAAQEMRQANADQYATSQMDALEQSRQNALGRLKGPQSGLTEIQIQEQQYQNAQKLYAMENNPARLKIVADIKAKQDEIYNLQQLQNAELAKIKTKEDEIYNIENTKIRPIQTNIDALTYENIVLQNQIDKQVASLKVMGQTRGEWDLTFAKIDASALASKNLDTAFGALLTSATAINNMWASILSKIQQYAAGVPGSVTTQQNNFTPPPVTKPKTTTTPEADAAANQANAMVAFALAKTTDDVNTAVSDAVKAGLTPSVVANAMASSLVGTGMSAADAAMTARWTGQGLAYQAQVAAQEKAQAARVAADAAMFPGGRRGGYSSGGFVPKYFAIGGFAKGTDTVPAMLTPGEFVMSKYAVDNYGTGTMKAINNGSQQLGSVYNYELTVNVKSDANANDIANTVMTKIKQVDSMRLRGNKL